MLEFIGKLAGDKKEYNAQVARIAALPKDYRFVMEKIQRYIWGFASGDGADMLKVQAGLVELFEVSAAEGTQVLDVTGEDVVGFCNELLRNAKLWPDNYRDKLNRDILNKLGRREDTT